MVREALAHHRPAERQRLAAYALVLRDDAVLLTRNSARGPRPGTWTLPGGGVDHGEPPAVAVAREVREETGLVATVGDAARRARRALHRHRAARARGGLPRRRTSSSRPTVSGGRTAGRTSVDGTTDAVAWVAAGRRRRPAPSRCPRWSPPRWRWARLVRLAAMSRDRLHLRRTRPEVRRGRLRRDRLRPLPVRRQAGPGDHRPGRRGDRAPAAGRRPDGASSASRRRSSTAPTSSRPTPASRRRSRTPGTPARGTPSSRSAAAPPSTPPRRSTCSPPTTAS